MQKEFLLSPQNWKENTESEVKNMNWDRVTVQDCIDMYEKKNKCAVLNDGHVTNFVED